MAQFETGAVGTMYFRARRRIFSGLESPLWLGLEPRRKVRPSPRLDFKVDQKS